MRLVVFLFLQQDKRLVRLRKDLEQCVENRRQNVVDVQDVAEVLADFENCSQFDFRFDAQANAGT